MQRRLLTSMLPATIGLILDQLSKIEFQKILLDPWQQVELLPFFTLTPVWNYGVSFGMFSGDNTALPLSIVTGLLSMMIAVWLYRAKSTLEQVSLSLILGGAIGNLIDRIAYGAVFDFLDFHWNGWHYPAFNIADSCIVVGVGILLLSSFKTRKTEQPA